MEPAEVRVNVVQFEPDATALLAAVADLLDDEVIGAVPNELRHRVRVAGHICRLVGREVQFAPEADRSELARLAELGCAGNDLEAARAALVDRLENAAPLIDERDVHAALMATVRADLAIAKPGYDS